jgi:pimeloyl-ACP methyl ester carboxylesterase
MPKVKVGDIHIHYEIKGKGEPLLLIMGIGGKTTQWRWQVNDLARDFRVIVFDNRGAGNTDRPDIEYTMKMFADDTAGLLQALNIKQASVFGISMGGMIALEFACQYPELVKRLILGCTTPGGRKSVVLGKDAQEVMTSNRKLGMEQFYHKMIPWVFSADFLAKNPDIGDQWVALQLENPTPEYSYQRQWEATMHHNTFRRLPQINVPTLVITGSDDKLIPPQNSEIMAREIPGAKLVMLEGAGHCFFVEKTEETNKIIRDFIKNKID